MNDKQIPILALLLLAGCNTLQVHGLTDREYGYEWASTKSPPVIVECLTAKAKEQPWVLVESRVDKDGTAAVVARNAANVTATARVAPLGSGSVVRTRTAVQDPSAGDEKTNPFLGC